MENNRRQKRPTPRPMENHRRARRSNQRIIYTIVRDKYIRRQLQLVSYCLVWSNGPSPFAIIAEHVKRNLRV